MNKDLEHNTQNQNFQLPSIKDIQIKLIPYKPPKHRYFESSFSKYTQAIEFTVLTDNPIPIRALSPALYVGKIPATEGESLSENKYRFLAFEINKLQDNEPIYFAWQGDPEALRIKTRFTYKKPTTIENSTENR
ncbi:MAG TPA: hypothetical protein VLA74_02115 [Nitrososphaeraceae archaeon]|nr:hypothetical protein [Nitrososphaeraceae archaeon]